MHITIKRWKQVLNQNIIYLTCGAEPAASGISSVAINHLSLVEWRFD